MRKKVFFDTEFTGLHQKTTLISLGCVLEDGRTFYAEFTDYAVDQLNQWLHENVMDKLEFGEKVAPWTEKSDRFLRVKGDTEFIKNEFVRWLEPLGGVEFWADCPAFDWVLICNMFGDAFKMPPSVYYVPFDLCTLFAVFGPSAAINRETFVGPSNLPSGKKNKRHNALWDARLAKTCFEMLMRE